MTIVAPAGQPSGHRRHSGARVVTRPSIHQAADVEPTRGIVVGIDGSAASVNALRWALREGVTRGVEVHVLFCWDRQPLGGFPAVPLDEGAGADHAAGSVLSKAMTAVRQLTAERPAGSPVRTDIVRGRAGALLVDLAVDGQLLVVGSRGHGGITGLVLGSVGQQCLTHARTPVVVVHSTASGHELPAHPRPDDGIVVGVDGSENSVVALRWALRESELREVPVHVVCVRIVPVVAGTSPSTPTGTADLRAAAREALDATVTSASAFQGPRSPHSPITAEVLEGGSATDVLTTAADHAELLVLGTRGRGGFVGLLLGSVSARCAAHAHCPVVVVANDRDDIVREPASDTALVPSLA